LITTPAGRDSNLAQPGRYIGNKIMEQEQTQHIHEDVPGGVPLKMWTRGVPVEPEAKRQLTNAARLPIVFKHIAAMPDVRFGIGATVGSVIPTIKALIPAAVGVDIGCGMIACKSRHRTHLQIALPHPLAPRSLRRVQR
jgi:tRNA-splicing ligase RtcB